MSDRTYQPSDANIRNGSAARSIVRSCFIFVACLIGLAIPATLRAEEPAIAAPSFNRHVVPMLSRL
ncbi:MAG: hypothetical protein K8T89_03815, partial [Planctomycetes bacterium]|nr:hypothetical protein [Planctomycetota bacterium]